MSVCTRLLNAPNSFAGPVAIEDGVVHIQNNTSLGSTGAGTTVADGATLQIEFVGALAEDAGEAEGDAGFVALGGLDGFEADFVDRAATPKSFLSLVNPPERVTDTFASYQKYLWASNAFVEKVYQLDKEKALDGAGTPESVRFLNERLAAGSQMLVDLWYTAWLESAEPLPEGKSEN